MDVNEAIVVDPPGFDVKAGWAWCHEQSKDGCVYPDGEVNWRAAFSADPGIVSCPVCQQMHWAWGRRQRCTVCEFEYPTDWWAMYSWGCAAAARDESKRYKQDERMTHPYYKYGFEHPVPDPYTQRHLVPWREVLS